MPNLNPPKFCSAKFGRVKQKYLLILVLLAVLVIFGLIYRQGKVNLYKQILYSPAFSNFSNEFYLVTNSGYRLN
jgi:hypothetical protein